jgi:hypothetical protein
MTMNMDERWVRRTPAAMLDTFHWFRGEAFQMIVDDLRALPSDRGIVVEGFRLLPRLVAPLAAPGRAVWLLPTPGFRQAAFARRDNASFLKQTSDPARALQNLLARDAMFTAQLRDETGSLGLASVSVTEAVSEDELVHAVRQALSL